MLINLTLKIMNEIIKKNGITYGIIIGLFTILYTTAIYSIDLALFTNAWIGVITMIIYITIGVVLVSKTKKQLNNNITFKEAFTVYFLAAVVGSTISTLFNILLFNFIDPEAKEKIKELSIKYAVEVLEKFGSPDSAVNETIKKMGETDAYSARNLLMGLAFSFVFSAIFGLILAAIFKSKPSYNE